MNDDLISPFVILKHLKTYLPRLTELFNEKDDLTAEILTGTPQTLRIILNTHGLQVDDEIVLYDGLLDNGITAVSQSTEPDGTKILRFTTNVNHDLTMDYEDNLTNGQIEMREFTDSQFNGFFDLYDVPSRNTFEIANDNLPSLNSNEILREIWENGINGIFTVSNIVDTNTFDIILTDKPSFDILAIPQLKKAKKFRMSTAATFERAKEIYTKQSVNNLWLFIIMDDAIVSKDRNIESDATHTDTAQNPQRTRIINEFAIDIFVSTKEDLGAANVSQLVWSDIFIFMLAVMQGVKFETFDNSNFLTSLVGHGAIEANNAFYVHGYSFEYVFDIVDIESFVKKFIISRAYRDVGLSFSEVQDGSKISLDDE